MSVVHCEPVTFFGYKVRREPVGTPIVHSISGFVLGYVKSDVAFYTDAGEIWLTPELYAELSKAYDRNSNQGVR